MGACTSPITAYQPIGGGSLTFGKEPPNHRELQIRCGQCMDCRIERSRQWAIRCVHEAKLHEQNCFITLTYNDDNLPNHGSLYKPHFQDFIKRLRYHCGHLRYYACGEYGETTDRAHYHACLFGYDFHDKIEFKRVCGNPLYLSKTLTDIWGHGNTSVGAMTFETAAYCASYVTKKLSKGQARYVRVDEETGEIIPLQQPFALMSLRPAIGKEWFDKYHTDIYNHEKDFITMRGKKMKPPKYYDALYDRIEPLKLETIKQNRQLTAEPEDYATKRARAEITRARSTRKTQI